MISSNPSSHPHHPPPPPPPLPTQPLIAPRPQRFDPSIPANMARTLDDQLQAGRGPSPAFNPSPGFAFSNRIGTPMAPLPTPAPPPGSNYPDWSPWAASPPSYPPAPPNPINYAPVGPSHQLSIPPTQIQNPQTISPDAPPLRNPFDPAPHKAPSPSKSPLPNLTAPLPTIPNLTAALPSIQQPSTDPAIRISWARDVVFLVDRLQSTDGSGPHGGPVAIADPQLQRLCQVAVQVVLQVAGTSPMPVPIPSWAAEAIYLRATFESSGGCPDLVPRNPRNAFRDFEAAARAGYAAAWFRLGRDYENFQDYAHAKDCFERGVKLNVESCCYRMAMAQLLGQLDLQVSFEKALPLLLRAATLSSLEVPQPAYIYSLILLNEFKPVTIPPHLFAPLIPPGSSPLIEARKHLERAAYLNFAPAQYKLGHMYELAQPPFPFDALLSVQYYSLASQQGEAEADMALSKWFLCGSEGAFDKDDGLAYTFADKAARKALPSAEFAMGFYAEVGIGRSQDLEVAKRWYKAAADHGMADAVERLAALSKPVVQSLSRQELDALTEHKLVRKRTQARERSEVSRPTVDGHRVIEAIRKQSLRHSRVEHGPMHQISEGGPRSESPRPFPAMQRYSLADSAPSGAAPASPKLSATQPELAHRTSFNATQPHRGSSPLPAKAAAPVAPPPQATLPIPRPASSGKHPATFAEMGIQGAKAEDKDCVIM